jgi:hypothetical protein
LTTLADRPYNWSKGKTTIFSLEIKIEFAQEKAYQPGL